MFFLTQNVTDIPLTNRPNVQASSRAKGEPPPSYTTLQRSPCTHNKDKKAMHADDAHKQVRIILQICKVQFHSFDFGLSFSLAEINDSMYKLKV